MWQNTSVPQKYLLGWCSISSWFHAQHFIVWPTHYSYRWAKKYIILICDTPVQVISSFFCLFRNVLVDTYSLWHWCQISGGDGWGLQEEFKQWSLALKATIRLSFFLNDSWLKLRASTCVSAWEGTSLCSAKYSMLWCRTGCKGPSSKNASLVW